ncbi:5-oxoprolinase subunit PxpA [Ruicaihuangia caeni]|uniref:5-oxoprolinase subunit PxpA n=1 Tax=Ruicaihuangia caeni TaxID=3042517 RepID=A0AAW6T7M2_9MICO|nr:5-oxoprolinase subunit PxpA [Klugiella sp. YN-L-19]MDI2099091.1 5-oxoprolinase subunit PxpA [Klugiella sp. YN-L-19]
MTSSHLTTLDLNADMGEGYGNWSASDDQEIMKHITTANIACGFHAGDPLIMNETVGWAQESGVAVGAHPGAPDLMGFGRRVMALTEDDIHAYITYQVGALSGFLRQRGMRLHHIKPHGAMYHMLKDEKLAAAAVRAMQTVDPQAVFYWPGPFGHEPITRVAADAGMRVFVEAYPDLNYSPEGNLIVERRKQPVSADLIEERVTRLLTEQTYEAIDGTILPLKVDSVCIHSDGPNVVEVAQAVRRAADSVGVTLAACE